MGIETELAEAAAALTRLDERRAAQAAYRDDVVRRALAAGVSWRQVQNLSGLSARGVQLVMRRSTQ